MKFSVAVALFGLCLLQVASAAPSDKVDCEKLDQALDENGLIQGITTLNGKDKMFKTEEEFAKRCLEMAEAVKTLRKYNKECNTALTQQVFSAILRTRSQMNELHCTKIGTPETKAVIEAVKCIAEEAFDQVNEAEKRTILTTQVLLETNIPDEKLRVRRACCNVLDTKKIFLESTKAKCGKSQKVFDDYYESYTSEALGLICPDADKLDCDKLDALKIEGVQAKYKFFIAPTIKLVKTLDH